MIASPETMMDVIRVWIWSTEILIERVRRVTVVIILQKGRGVSRGTVITVVTPNVKSVWNSIFERMMELAYVVMTGSIFTIINVLLLVVLPQHLMIARLVWSNHCEQITRHAIRVTVAQD
jgi:hypothetical protein